MTYFGSSRLEFKPSIEAKSFKIGSKTIGKVGNVDETRQIRWTLKSMNENERCRAFSLALFEIIHRSSRESCEKGESAEDRGKDRMRNLYTLLCQLGLSSSSINVPKRR